MAEKVVMTDDSHTSGTTRVAEAIQHSDCSHVILIQGDEPLLLPEYLDAMAERMRASPEKDSWNATGDLEKQEELGIHSFVKCLVADSNGILCCFRKSPFFSDFERQRTFVRKILGLIAYRKDFLIGLADLPHGKVEQSEHIEQMRILENGFKIFSIPMPFSLPSVNEPHEVSAVLERLEKDEAQRLLFQKISDPKV